MKRLRTLYTVFPVLLAFCGYAMLMKLPCAALLRRAGLSAWLANLLVFAAASLTAALLFALLYPRDVEAVHPFRTSATNLSAARALLFIPCSIFLLISFTYIATAIFPAETGQAEPVWQSLLSAALIHPLCEEIIFRGLFQNGIAQNPDETGAEETMLSARDMLAVLMQGILFALVHTGTGGMIYGLLGGILLGYVYLRTGRLWICILIHMLINARAVLYPVLPQNFALWLDVALLILGAAAFFILWLLIHADRRHYADGGERT